MSIHNAKITFVVVTPVRNEGKFFRKTIESVLAQTAKPLRWIIVDDGSTDDTGRIADQVADSHSWIRVLHRPDRGFRKSGGGVIEAFYDGFPLIAGESWEFIVKLDGDLSFETTFFEKSFARFKCDPRLGVGGGTICASVAGCLVEESVGDPAFHVRGATKMYRRACWEAIGGLVKAPGWDTLDEVKANMLGWRTYTFRDIMLEQHRHTGGADGRWKNWVKNGLANYNTGYHPLFMACKCLKRAVRGPSVVIPVGLGWGFLSGYLKRLPRPAGSDVVRYVRREQLNRLLLRPSLWGKAIPQTAGN